MHAAIINRFRKVSRTLPPHVLARLRQARRHAPILPGAVHHPELAYEHTQRFVRSTFPTATAGALDDMVFYVLAVEGPSDLADRINEWQDKKDQLSDFEGEAQRLQMQLDRRSTFARLLSTIMKRMSETSAGIVSNLK